MNFRVVRKVRKEMNFKLKHYCDAMMGIVSSQITSLTIVYSTVYSDADQSKHQSCVSLAFVWGIHRGPVNSPHKWPVTRKMFPFDDVIMITGLNTYNLMELCFARLVVISCFELHEIEIYSVWVSKSVCCANRGARRNSTCVDVKVQIKMLVRFVKFEKAETVAIYSIFIFHAILSALDCAWGDVSQWDHERSRVDKLSVLAHPD